ncbi:MAG: hypothetical protein ACR2H8_06220 [Candidatus Nanopelagicaceae bacterium]
MSVSLIFLMSAITFWNITPVFAYAGTLENGNLAYAESEFNKGEACNYLPGFESGYDAWHFVLTSRGATFMQSSSNVAVAINLNLVFMRTDGSTYVIQSGAWVQTGKGAYVYTLTKDKDRMVQTGSLAKINGLDSGMRLSHTCPGSGNPPPITTPSPTSTPSPTTSSSSTFTPAATTTATPNSTPTSSSKFVGTLENGDQALADSSFNKGEACDYLPSYESGYDAWHFVLTTRGSTFVQNINDPKQAIQLHITFLRTNGTTYTITSGAWVQTGKGSYVYTKTADKDRIVQSQSYATTENSSSGMRLSHTCPGEGEALITSTPTATPTTTVSKTPCPCDIIITKTKKILPTPTPTRQPINSQSPNATPSSTRTPGPSRSPSTSPSATPTSSPIDPQELIPPVLPTPPVLDDPEKTIFVDPNEPIILPPNLFPNPPSTPISIIEPPKYGVITQNPGGGFVYTSILTDPQSTLVDSVTFSYTDLSGKTVVVRKQFVLGQQGDMPSIIQTGLKSLHSNVLAQIKFILILLFFVSFFSIVRRKRNSNEI